MGQFEAVKAAFPLQAYADERLQRVGNKFVCPACGSGTGPHHTPAFSIAPSRDRWKCFACGASGDIFDLVGIVEGIDDRRRQLEVVAERAGVDVSGPASDFIRPIKIKAPSVSPDATKGAADDDSSAFYAEGRRAEALKVAEWQRHGHDAECVAYLAARGFDESIVDDYGLGYDPERRRVVISYPGVPYYHIDRAIDDAQAVRYVKPTSMTIGAEPLWGADAIEAGVFFVVEGVLDALAVMSCGFPAVALCGTGSDRLLYEIKRRQAGGAAVGAAVVMLDHDEAGRKAAEGLIAALDERGVDIVDATRGDEFDWKDAAEMLSIDRSFAVKFLTACDRDAAALSSRPDDLDLVDAECANVLDVLDRVYAGESQPAVFPTGIEGLDAILRGGIQAARLTVIGASTSAGKTTFCLQVADRVAESGRHVLYVTLEQGADELVAKSVSRMMSESGQAYTARDVGDASRRATWTDADWDRLLQACGRYAEHVAPRLHICERRVPVAKVCELAQAIAAGTGEPPVVIIDYLQLLPPAGDRMTDKQAVDANVAAIRGTLAREIGCAVVLISALNRAANAGAIAIDAWKESGSIEYSADVLLALQPRDMAARLDAVADTRQKRTADKITRETKAKARREMELVVLKNRGGATTDEGIPVIFDAPASRFIEDTGAARRVTI